MKRIIEDRKVVITNEKIGDADYSVTVETNKQTGLRRALIPLDGSMDVCYYNGRKACVNDVIWFGRFTFEIGHPYCNPKGMCLAIDLVA